MHTYFLSAMKHYTNVHILLFLPCMQTESVLMYKPTQNHWDFVAQMSALLTYSTYFIFVKLPN